jgi:beta-glucosidase
MRLAKNLPRITNYVLCDFFRWYTANQVTPVFPFGHGLSYTTFRYDSLSGSVTRLPADTRPSSPKSVVAEYTVTVTNTGARDGYEVVQLYLTYPASALGEPPRQLKAFAKAFVAAGQSTPVSLALTFRDVCTWDAGVHDWVQAVGAFQVEVGASVADIRLTATLEL